MVDRTPQIIIILNARYYYHASSVVLWLAALAVIIVAPSANAFAGPVSSGKAPPRLFSPVTSPSPACYYRQKRSTRTTNIKSQVHPEGVPPPITTTTSFELLTPVFATLIASASGTLPATQSVVLKTCGTLPRLQAALAVLMLAMGFTMTPPELEAALREPRVIVANAVLCFGVMPVVAWTICQLFAILPILPTLRPSQRIGTILLGCVSGGQASNLFTLLAGGDVALSVVCTLSTTLLGVIATPLLVGAWLGASVPVQLTSVLRSVATLVLAPLVTGLALGRLLEPTKNTMKGDNAAGTQQRVVLQTIRSQWCPKIGLLATMILVAGGASNAAVVGGSSIQAVGTLASSIAISILLPILGGCIALQVASSRFLVPKPREGLPEPSKRALVIEVLSKSPTLAHVLALRHFGVEAAAIPAISMVSLALVGALVASVWQSVDPI